MAKSGIQTKYYFFMLKILKIFLKRDIGMLNSHLIHHLSFANIYFRESLKVAFKDGHQVDFSCLFPSGVSCMHCFIC